jgi:hypothetical protein
VRLASTPKDLRLERVEKLRRERAASRALRVAFPAIQQLRLELTFESSASNTPGSQSHVLHPAARAFFVFPCPYADCDGGFDLTTQVNAALSNVSGQARGVVECSGQRLVQHNSRGPCKLHLTYAIAATYQRGE